MSTVVDGGDPEVLVQVAERHRQAQKKAEPAEPNPADDATPRRPRRRIEAKRPAGRSTDTIEKQPAKAKKAKAVARTSPSERSMLARLGAWGVAACAAALALLVLTVDGLHEVPAPLPVSSVRVSWLQGPQIPVNEVLAWLDRFPDRDRLREPNAWVLDRLAAFLRDQPAVARVQQVRLEHEPATSVQGARRTLEIVVGLRQPVMPVVLASGERAWIDVEGRVLPGILPGPEVRRPQLRGLEGAQPGVIVAALHMWALLEPELEPGLVSWIQLDDQLDERGARGIVLYTRQGSRLIWGDPDEQRYGVKAEAKARDLVHTIRCQGDMSRVATINVRYSQPVFTFRE
jgi:hypothetical protein